MNPSKAESDPSVSGDNCGVPKDAENDSAESPDSSKQIDKILSEVLKTGHNKDVSEPGGITDTSNALNKDQKNKNSDSSTHSQNVHYEGDIAIYTDPDSGTPDSSTHSQNVHYEGDIAIYTDPDSGIQYQWDKDKDEWVAKTKVVYGFEDDTHVYTDSDGIKYFWDKGKTAWFPKVDDDFMAHYQMNYGFIDNTKIEVKQPIEMPQVEKKPKKEKGEKRKASEPTWFELEESKNTSVYVSNLPTDIDEEEFIEQMQKCGLVYRDPQSGKFKVKLYREQGTDILKGDALCTYIKVESVELALNLLDGFNFKGHRMKVERARFEMKGSFDPKLKPKMKKKKEKLKMQRQQQKLFDWRPEKKLGERAKHEKVVVVRNLFDRNIFDADVGLILEFQQDLRDECSKYGEVRKVIIYDRHPEGVAQINMSSPEEADEVVNLLNGRWFMKRQLSAEIWDGRTKFKIAETDSEISQRLSNWDEFLEGGEAESSVGKVTTNNSESLRQGKTGKVDETKK